MVIRSSSSRDIQRLIGDLCDGNATQREAAVARLRIIGGRAVACLAALIASEASPAARAAAVRALDGVDQARALAIARAAVADADPDVATAAIAMLRGWLTRESGTDVLDLLSGIALDTTRNAGVRLAALDALSELPRHLVQPLQQAAPDLRAAPDAAAPGGAVETDDPFGARQWVAAHPRAPLSTLHDVLLRTREHERREPSARTRQAWLMARGAAHRALARRGSRVAVYDLRESFETAQEPLPLDFLSAVRAVGDATCLEPLARAWTACAGDPWWRERVRDAAGEIIRRKKLRGQHAAVTRVRTNYPEFLPRRATQTRRTFI